jgi:hypothetical protein
MKFGGMIFFTYSNGRSWARHVALTSAVVDLAQFFVILACSTCIDRRVITMLLLTFVNVSRSVITTS